MITHATFLKSTIISKQVRLDMRVFFNLSEQEFNFLLASVLIFIDEDYSDKMFTARSVSVSAKTNLGITLGTSTLLKIMKDLIEKGYFVFVGNIYVPGIDLRNHFRISAKFSIVKEKINHFIAVHQAFIDLESSHLNNIKEVKLGTTFYKNIKKDVVKHMRELKKLKRKK
jgi:hypothetical protein